MQRIKAAHCIASLSPETGGTARVVRDLTDTLNADVHCLSILLLSQGIAGSTAISGQSQTGVDERLAISRSAFILKTGWALKRSLQAVVRQGKPDILHDHGIWLPANHHVAATATQHKIPLVVHPHGMLEPWPLKHHAHRKQLALRLYQRRDLESAALIFATAEQEAENIRRLGFRQPIAMVPNGVALPHVQTRSVNMASPRDRLHCAVFMSRIHPKKGLPNLVEAWSRLRPPNWRLLIAGPDEGGHLDEVMRTIQVLRLEESVKYVGSVEGSKKQALLEDADLFVLPSFSENFGLVVAEALAYGVPVITTRGTPWKDIRSNGCGWWIEPTVSALSESLREAFAMDIAILQGMGQKGRAYVRKFDWAHIARQTADVYRWVLGQGARPECVMRD